MGKVLDSESISAELALLVGLPCWYAGVSAGMFQAAFGGKHERKSQLGVSRTVGDFALHVQCAWRVASRDSIICGFADDVEADGDPSVSRFLSAAIERFLADEPIVESVGPVVAGGFALALSNGLSIEVFPTLGAPDQDLEFWRLLRPAWPGPHFVVGSQGAGHDS